MSKRPPDDDPAERDPGEIPALRDMEAAARRLLQSLSSRPDPPEPPSAGPRRSDPETTAPLDRPASPLPPSAEVDALALLKSLAEQRGGDADPARPSKPETLAPRPPASRWGRLLRALDRHPYAAWAGIAVLALLVFSAMAAVLWDLIVSHDHAREAGTAPIATTVPAVPAPPPSTATTASSPIALDMPAIVSAMKDCDDQAAKDHSTLYFLVVPLAPTKGTIDEWAAKGERYDSFILLTSKTMMEGVNSQSLAPQPVRYSFALYDEASRRSYNLGTSVGVSKSAQHDAAWLGNFRLGFDRSGTGQNFKWTTEFQRRVGVCYWVNVIFRN